jgi:hypothetical protein
MMALQQSPGLPSPKTQELAESTNEIWEEKFKKSGEKIGVFFLFKMRLVFAKYVHMCHITSVFDRKTPFFAQKNGKKWQKIGKFGKKN